MALGVAREALCERDQIRTGGLVGRGALLLIHGLYMIAARPSERNLSGARIRRMASRRMAVLLPLLASVLLTLGAPRDGRAEVTRVEFTTRADVGSRYEKLVGTAHFAVNPRDPRNAVIADIAHAPVNAQGRVEFSSDLYILRPKDPARANGIALVEVLNRGRKLVLNGFTRGAANDPVTEADLGDAFLLERGFTLVWVGWEFDVRRTDGLMGISVPNAQGIDAAVAADFTPDTRDERQVVSDLAGYQPADPGAAANTLTVRDTFFGAAQTIERGRWTLAGNAVTLNGGFEPGRIYRLSYRPVALPLSGLGLAAFRDIGSWIRHSADASLRTRQTLAFGSSQSGRFLRTFLYHGFNVDEQGRQVFDAGWAHIAGAAQLDVNARGATPTSLTMYEITRFPYATVASRDPISGRTEGLLDNDRAKAAKPRMFFTNTSVEYWGGGRNAALVHTSPDGTTDLDLGPDTRVYYLTGAQHGPARFPTRVARGQQPDNPLEYWWTMRALMVAMEQWLKAGTPPPPSQHPRLADGTLVPAASVRFPPIPGVQPPSFIEQQRRNGQLVPFLVPQVDADGNETAGIRTAESRVPLATYTGWNYRNVSTGGPKLLVSLLGARIPFAGTAAERQASGDPRPSVAERYATADAYRALAKAAVDETVARGFLLPGDASSVLARMEQQWRAATGAADR